MDTIVPPASPHKSPVVTPQMSVLGRDGRDFDRILGSAAGKSLLSEQPDASPSSPRHEKRTWLSWFLFNRSKDSQDQDEEASYASMTDLGREQQTGSTTSRRQAALRRPPRAVFSSLQDQHASSSSVTTMFQAVATSANPSKQDVVRQDCSFFYQDMEVDDVQTATHQDGPLNTYELDTDPRYRAAYRARFQQLNEVRHGNLCDDMDDHELYFYDEEEQTQPPRVADVTRSSLCWEQDGRILMRLPKDKVRLLMDPHLEPGILSVDYSNSTSDKDRFSMQEVSYVMTVDDNLYKRVVTEIAGSSFSFCNFHHFCLDEGRVDIWVAVVLLIVILAVLLVNTIIWPVD